MKSTLCRLTGAALALVATVARAQTTADYMLSHPEACAGVYMPYNCTAEGVVDTPPPDGFMPFYVSHYGRHGSRYLINETDYTAPLHTLEKASEIGILTPLGESLLEATREIAAEADGRAGELTPLGVQQHHDIATRLYKACPAAFADSTEISAVSTVRMRCAHSMFSFCEALKEQNTLLRITIESSARHMHYMSYNLPEASHFNRADGPWAAPVGEFKSKMTNPARLMSTIFTNTHKASKIADPGELMWQLYWLAADAPNMVTDRRLWGIFTDAELFNLWQSFNYEFYTRNSANPLNRGLFVDSAKNLLKNMLDSAESHIATLKPGATLRFGHDSTIIPFAALMHFDNCDGNETDPNRLYLTYADWRVSPMASNIQMRFYHNHNGDVIVKFLLNEKETTIPCPTDIYPYYRWEDARAAIIRLLNTPAFDLFNIQS